MTTIMLSILCVTVCQTGDTARIRERVFGVLDYRAPRSTSQVLWTLSHYRGMQAGLTQEYLTETIGPDFRTRGRLFDDKSDEDRFQKQRQALLDAYVPPRPGIQLRTDYSASTDVITYNGDVLSWEGRPWVHTWDRASRHPNYNYSPMTFGLGPQLGTDGDTMGVGGRELDENSWSESSDGATVSVRTTRGLTIEWQLDPQRDDQPVSVRLLGTNGVPTLRSETTLQKLGDRWYPESVTYYTFVGGAEELFYSIRVEEATFDLPDHRQTLWDPSDMGAGFGWIIWSKGGATPLARYWDGAGLISEDEFKELAYGYEIPLDPAVIAWGIEQYGGEENYRRDQERFKARWRKEYEAIHGYPYPDAAPLVPDEWDVYVANFIKKHGLDKHRTDVANDLLKRAKKLRDFYRSKQPKANGSTEDERNAKKLSDIEKKIFERFLVQGLEKLIPKSERFTSGNR